MEKDTHENIITEHARRLDIAEAREKRRRNSGCLGAMGSVGGAVAGATACNYLFGDSLSGLGESAAEVLNAINTAKILTQGNSTGEYTELQLKEINPEIRAEYSASQDTGIVDGFSKAYPVVLDASGRASENFPGAQNETVKIVRGIKGKIFEAGRGLFFGEEEAATTNTEEYQVGYNQLGRLEDAATFKIHELDVAIKDYSTKMTLNESRTGNSDKKSIDTLEQMVSARNDIYQLREQLGDVPIKTIYEGIENNQYQTLIESANNYGITEPDFSNAGDAVAISGALIAGLVGAKVGKYFGHGAQLIYNTGSLANNGRKKVQEKIKKRRKS